MFVRKLPWRSELVNKFFFAELDGMSLEKKTAQAKRQRKKRMFSHDNKIKGFSHPIFDWDRLFTF